MGRVVVSIVFVTVTLFSFIFLLNYIHNSPFTEQTLALFLVVLPISFILFGLSIVLLFRQTREYIANLNDQRNTLSSYEVKKIDTKVIEDEQTIGENIGCGVSIILNILQFLFGIVLFLIGGALMVFDITHKNPSDIPTIIIHIILIIVALKVGLNFIISVFNNLVSSDGC